MEITTSPNNLYIACIGKYGIVQISYFDSMKLFREVKITYGRAVHISFFPDNQHLLVCDHDSYHQKPDTLEVFDLLDGSCVSTCRIDDINDPIISHDGQSVYFSFGIRSSLAKWDWQTSDVPSILFDGRVFKRNEYFVRSLSPNSNKLIVTKYLARDWPKIQEYKDTSDLEIWDVKSGSVIKSFQGYQRAVSLPDDQQIIAVNAESGILTILNIESKKIEKELAPPIEKPILPWSGQLLVSSNGRYLVANIGVWEISTWRHLYELPWREYKKLTLTADSRYVLYYPGHERWDLESNQHITLK